MAGIDDEVAALDFDLACTLRLQIYDNERRTDEFKTLAKILGTSGDDDEESADTEVW